VFVREELEVAVEDFDCVAVLEVVTVIDPEIDLLDDADPEVDLEGVRDALLEALDVPLVL
jgi:hypothetical protein